MHFFIHAISTIFKTTWIYLLEMQCQLKLFFIETYSDLDLYPNKKFARNFELSTNQLASKSNDKIKNQFQIFNDISNRQFKKLFSDFKSNFRLEKKIYCYRKFSNGFHKKLDLKILF